MTRHIQIFQTLRYFKAHVKGILVLDPISLRFNPKSIFSVSSWLVCLIFFHTSLLSLAFILFAPPVLYHGEGNGIPLQYSSLENPTDRGAWWAAVHGVEKSRTRLSDFTFTFHFHTLEKEMATHSSVLAWRIPGTGEPGGLPSVGSHRVGHDWSDLAAAAAAAVLYH